METYALHVMHSERYANFIAVYRTKTALAAALKIVLDRQADMLDKVMLELLEHGYREHYPVLRLYRERWPLIDSTGAVIQEHLYYGFSHATGCFGKLTGYGTQTAAILDIKAHCDFSDEDISTDPKQLGGTICVVMTGRQFVNRVYQGIQLDLEAGVKGDVAEYLGGCWSEAQ